MLSQNDINNINTIIVYKLNKILNTQNLFYIKSDIILYLIDEYQLNIYESDAIYNYLLNEINNNQSFNKNFISSIQDIQNLIKDKFYKNIDEQDIKLIFKIIKKKYYN
tara:strand:- start:731 stop:1054 length:324 start_codon:yes stop_codon:yes gene_type:complete